MYYENGRITLTAAVDIEEDSLVSLNADGLAEPCAGGKPIGVTEKGGLEGRKIAVRLLSAGGTVEINAASAINVGDAVGPAGDGKVSGGASAPIGVALTACDADELVEVILL